MKNITHTRAERGMALVSSLLLLLVVTIMAIAMFRSYGIQERIAGNVREKQRAVHAAEIAEGYAEFWLTRDNNAATATVDCTQTKLLDATLGQGQICLSTLQKANIDVLQPPWGGTATPIGVTYVPSGSALTMNISASPSWTAANGLGIANVGSYYAKPTFYISDLGPSAVAGVPGEVYQIDAAGYGTTANAVAVVESTFVVGPEVVNLGGL